MRFSRFLLTPAWMLHAGAFVWKMSGSMAAENGLVL